MYMEAYSCGSSLYLVLILCMVTSTWYVICSFFFIYNLTSTNISFCYSVPFYSFVPCWHFAVHITRITSRVGPGWRRNMPGVSTIWRVYACGARYRKRAACRVLTPAVMVPAFGFPYYRQLVYALHVLRRGAACGLPVYLYHTISGSYGFIPFSCLPACYSATTWRSLLFFSPTLLCSYLSVSCGDNIGAYIGDNGFLALRTVLTGYVIVGILVPCIPLI
jgi:hypothetical protein